MFWSWFAFAVGMLVGALVPVGVKKLNELINKA